SIEQVHHIRRLPIRERPRPEERVADTKFPAEGMPLDLRELAIDAYVRAKDDRRNVGQALPRYERGGWILYAPGRGFLDGCAHPSKGDGSEEPGERPRDKVRGDTGAQCRRQALEAPFRGIKREVRRKPRCVSRSRRGEFSPEKRRFEAALERVNFGKGCLL